jgi:hypothetical protein
MSVFEPAKRGFEHETVAERFGNGFEGQQMPAAGAGFPSEKDALVC